MPELFQFIGGDDDTLVAVMNSIVKHGQLRFGAANRFNDLLEFSFDTVALPSRVDFDHWNRAYIPDLSPAELDDAWKTITRADNARYAAVHAPQRELLASTYVLCLSRSWSSNLMWAHYTSKFNGFCAVYDDSLLGVWSRRPDCLAYGDVVYSAAPPRVRWFVDPPKKSLETIILAKSEEWSYEREFRVALTSKERSAAHFETVDTALMRGVVLGYRACAHVRLAALRLKAERPDLTVTEILPEDGGYALRRVQMVDNNLPLAKILADMGEMSDR
jgi:hypothetical protein